MCQDLITTMTVFLISKDAVLSLSACAFSSCSFAAFLIVSASDVTPTDRWLIMHMAHKSENTSGVSKSSSDWLNYTGFPGDLCVAFFNVPPGNKDGMTTNPLTKEESHRVYNWDDKCLSGSTKRRIFKSI